MITATNPALFTATDNARATWRALRQLNAEHLARLLRWSRFAPTGQLAEEIGALAAAVYDAEQKAQLIDVLMRRELDREAGIL